MADPRIQEIRDTVDEQLAQLRAQVATLTKALSSRARDAAEQAGDTADTARGRIGTAVASARQQGHNVVEAARENPGAATSALLSAGLIGLAIGYLLGSSAESRASERGRHWHW
ncbi:hypothetical protein JJB09_03380 [Rhizobium sp. KVB221]|uniref:DUF883 domain-containing protein n=1 Tax=Rhizobium setariae TaxID=2801340 RepID=A0A937CJF9_9HYPH|nr:hypothetical protein [Rhizobium setariae]MBL0371060.1 hypothetical protein [Rhizobium setariae]